MNKMNNIKIAVTMILFFVLFSCTPPQQESQVEETSYGATPVKAFKVKKQKISEKLFYTGVIEAWKEINVMPDIGGKIAKIHVEEGEIVEKDQLLAELDTRAASLQQDQAKAGVAVAEASYNDAEKNMERMERLKNENAISDQQYEKVKLAYEAAEAQLQQAQAALNLANHQLDVSIMRAPFGGIVASKNAEEGDVINPLMGGFSAASGVLMLMDFSRVKIDVDVSQQDIVRIKKGQTASLSVMALAGKTFKGRVMLVNLTADPVSKKFKVEVEADNPGLELRPNTFGEVVFEVESHDDAVVIPQKAVLENKYVFLVSGDKVQKRDVVLGLQNTDMVEILSGLKEGDIVVVEGNFGLEEGTQIEVSEVIQ